MASLSNNKNQKIDFETDYWADYINGHLKEMFSANDVDLKLKKGFIELNHNGNIYYVIHPFWSKEHAENQIGLPFDSIKRISIFDLSKHINLQ